MSDQVARGRPDVSDRRSGADPACVGLATLRARPRLGAEAMFDRMFAELCRPGRPGDARLALNRRYFTVSPICTLRTERAILAASASADSFF